MTTTLSLSDALEAAAYALVGERCRHAHIHDMRGELQTLQSSLELLARSAKASGENIALADKATNLARRALANHEKSLVEFMNQVTPHDAAAVAVDVGEMVEGALRSLHNDAAGKSIAISVEAAPDLRIVAQPYRARLLVLGLLAMTIDELPTGAAVAVTLGQADSQVLIEIKSEVSRPAIRSPENLWAGTPPHGVPPYDLLLAVTSRWASTNGGRVESQLSPRPPALRIYYPRSLSA